MYTLLIVDDEPAIIEGMKRIIDWSVYSVSRIESALSFGEGFTRAVDSRPDICLFDIRIGDKMGYDLINRLDEVGFRSNYIMMSGYSEFKFALESLRCGAVEYLLKPVESNKLRESVEKVIVERLGGTISRQQPNECEIDPVLYRRYESLAPLIAKILMIVRTEYSEKITLTMIAEKFRMNPTYLGQIFFKESHMKFNEYLMCYRLIKARTLIETSDVKIAVVAEDVGYANINYFYTHFHSYFGASPTNMRENARRTTVRA